eukprot:TRINITY_DN9596_c0_g1_i4.p2 TRINITY_DN9596_c0_g1~~TRINITY_DN9596_c0_g1_i4.p2  ORF type:complete len:192 (-),score=29.19 TRINITY_DN9596_c0_g1_i4:643-1218(-)
MIRRPPRSTHCISSAASDVYKRQIYNINPNTTTLAGKLEKTGAATLDIIPYQDSVIGTGTLVNVLLNGEVIDSYRIVVFGDVTGDGNIDSMDAGTVIDVENKYIIWDPIKDFAFYKAGNVNTDSNVDNIDAGIIVDCENKRVNIDQSTGLAYQITFQRQAAITDDCNLQILIVCIKWTIIIYIKQNIQQTC